MAWRLLMRRSPNRSMTVVGDVAQTGDLAGTTGWELVYAMREDSIRKAPDAPKKFLAALEDVTKFLRADPDAADRIAVESVKLPPGVLKEAVLTRRWDFDARPAWGDERKSIWDTFERAVAAGFHPKLPDDAIIAQP